MLLALVLVAAFAAVGSRVSDACTKDTDCKGDRVCEQGRCVSPGAASSAPSPGVPPAMPPPGVSPSGGASPSPPPLGPPQVDSYNEYAPNQPPPRYTRQGFEAHLGVVSVPTGAIYGVGAYIGRCIPRPSFGLSGRLGYVAGRRFSFGAAVQYLSLYDKYCHGVGDSRYARMAHLGRLAGYILGKVAIGNFELYAIKELGATFYRTSNVGATTSGEPWDYRGTGFYMALFGGLRYWFARHFAIYVEIGASTDMVLGENVADRDDIRDSMMLMTLLFEARVGLAF